MCPSKRGSFAWILRRVVFRSSQTFLIYSLFITLLLHRRRMEPFFVATGRFVSGGHYLLKVYLRCGSSRCF